MTDERRTPSRPRPWRRDDRRSADGRPRTSSPAGRPGFLGRLSTGTGAFNILGTAKIYYIVSGRAGGRARSC